MNKLTTFLLKIYKKTISPVLVAIFGGACVYELTCSEYAAKAVEKYGIFKGGVKSAKRLLSCNAYFRSASFENI